MSDTKNGRTEVWTMESEVYIYFSNETRDLLSYMEFRGWAEEGRRQMAKGRRKNTMIIRRFIGRGF